MDINLMPKNENAAIEKCLEYSEKREKLKKLISLIKISWKLKTIEKHFEDDKENRIILDVSIERENRKINFDFGMSIHDTKILTGISKEKEEIKEGILYSVLSCIALDYNCPIDFDEFCNEYGYNNDSRKAEKIFHSCLKQRSKLEKIFDESEIDCMPS